MNLEILQTLKKVPGQAELQGQLVKNSLNPISCDHNFDAPKEKMLRGSEGHKGHFSDLAPNAPLCPQRENSLFEMKLEDKTNTSNRFISGAPDVPSAPREKNIVESQQEELKKLLTQIGLHYGAIFEEIDEEFNSVLLHHSLAICLATYRSVSQSLQTKLIIN